MATQTVEFEMVTGESGASAKLFSAGSDTVVATVTPTEATNRKGIYSAAFTDVAAGTYRLIGFGSDGTPLTDPLWVKLTLTTATFQAYVIPENVFVSSASSGTGAGARTVTITVNDGASALQNAKVRLTEGSNTYTATTNASGVATFNLDDATYTVAITKSGYSYSGTTLTVDGTETVTYSMTAINVTASTGDQTTGYLTTLDETGAAEAGVTIYCTLAEVPDDYGLALDTATRTLTSDADGLVEITGMVKGAVYNLRRGTKGQLFAVTIPTTAGSTYELPNMAGT